jgi:hypothetical protein
MSWSGSNMFNNPQQNAREAGEGFDTMQVCLNGHKISEYAATMPQFSKPHCSTCGGRTIQECPECHAPIQGHYNSPGVFSVSETPVPNNCHNCGTAYPWRQAAIASAIEVLQIDLIGQDAAEAAELVNAVAIDTPRTEISALKLKRLLPKLGKATYDVAVKVISDIASETAKKTLGLDP